MWTFVRAVPFLLHASCVQKRLSLGSQAPARAAVVSTVPPHVPRATHCEARLQATKANLVT